MFGRATITLGIDPQSNYELYSFLGAQVWHVVLTRDHSVLPATHTFTHKLNEPYLPLTPNRRVSPHFGWYSFPFPLRAGG